MDVTRLDISSFVLISPLEIFRLLQHLDLIPAWPLFPIPWNTTATSLAPLLYPDVPSQWSLRKIIGFAMGTCISPLPLLLGIHYFNRHLDAYLLSYARIVVPRPDCPDETSKRAYDEHPTNLDAWSMELNRGNRSLLDEIKSDLGVAMNQVEILRTRLGLNRSIRNICHFFSVSRRGRSSTTRTVSENLYGPSRVVGSAVHSPENRHELQPTANSGGSSAPGEFHARTEERRIPGITTAHHIPDHQLSGQSNSLPLVEDEVTGTGNIADRRQSRSTATPSPQLTASTDEEEIMMRALEQDNPVQITTSAGSTDTLHMNVEVNGASPGEPVFTSSFSASPRPTLVETVEVQHVEGSFYPAFLYYSLD